VNQIVISTHSLSGLNCQNSTRTGANQCNYVIYVTDSYYQNRRNFHSREWQPWMWRKHHETTVNSRKDRKQL